MMELDSPTNLFFRANAASKSFFRNYLLNNYLQGVYSRFNTHYLTANLQWLCFYIVWSKYDLLAHCKVNQWTTHHIFWEKRNMLKRKSLN